MNFDNSADFTFSKLGRLKLSPENETGSLGSPETITIPSRRRGGWADEGNKSGKMKQSLNYNELKRFQSEKQDSDDDIPVIPDIDDLPNDATNLIDVKIPNVTVKKATYKEIERDNKLENFRIRDSNFGNIGDIDLTLLTSRLYPEDEVKNPDDTWTLSSLALDLANSLETSTKTVVSTSG